VESFFERPILNSPYAHPDRHWELDDDGQPTNQILPERMHLDDKKISVSLACN
jgi:type III restriction enzyme